MGPVGAYNMDTDSVRGIRRRTPVDVSDLICTVVSDTCGRYVLQMSAYIRGESLHKMKPSAWKLYMVELVVPSLEKPYVEAGKRKAEASLARQWRSDNPSFSNVIPLRFANGQKKTRKKAKPAL